MATYKPKQNESELDITAADRKALADAWERGGHMVLSSCLRKIIGRFTVEQYGAAVLIARTELNDWTDYSIEPQPEP